MSSAWVLIAGFALAVAVVRWSSGQGSAGAAHTALVAVLGTTAATFNVIVPVPSVEATTTVVLCAAIALGVRTAVAVGVVAILGSSISGGIGAWTAWQIAAVVVVALVGALVGRTVAVRSEPVALACAAVLSTLAWDVIVTAGGVASYAPQPGLEPVLAALLLGAAFTLVHVAFTTLFTVLGGPPLLHALRRARPRLDGGVVVEA